jgi:uncharacterized protein (TIGR02145 family)
MKKQFCDERDGKRYVYVEIGEQTWMAENLNYDVCGSKCGDKKSIYGTSFLEDTNTKVCDEYGRLYDWHTALTICPAGWHLPSDEEWTALTDYAGGESVAGTKLKSAGGDWACMYSSLLLKKTVNQMSTFDCEGSTVEGTDDYGFSALPGGYGSGHTNYFYSVGEDGHWWSDTDTYCRNMLYYLSDVRKYKERRANFFFSVRCVKDLDN